MAKLRVVRVSLITLQLISLTVASVIIIVHYNPWIERMIDEAERSGNTSQSLADQIQRIEGEEIAIFLMAAATILVSVLGIIGTLRGHDGQHCLLNFYMSTLIIFLFVIFMALCGTIWEVISKVQYGQSSAQSSQVVLQSNSPTANPFDSAYDLVEEWQNGTLTGRNSVGSTVIAPSRKAPLATTVTWLYIAKSLLFISLSAALYATSLKLTRKILESSDDRYLSASDDGDEDDLNSEASSGGIPGIPAQYMIGFRNHTPYSNHSYNNFHHNIAGVYSNSMTKSSTGVAAIATTGSGAPGSPFRNV